jgi:Tol biopolymer transport system component/tRNA A-37 threonylcarbamoyl transferase component Bud32
MGLDPGTRLGPYEIVDALGAGGMGEVYKARDTRLDRTVAIKVLPRHLADRPESRQRFEREARTVSDLNHPHICTLHDIGREGGVDYLVMELLEGQTLAERIGAGPLPLDEALQYAVQIAEGLGAAHSRGVVHRDLKPANVMLTPTGAKLLDFGLARPALTDSSGATDLGASPTMTSPLTAQGTILGTFQYMAPEQLDGKDADARSDIFAFGAVLYEMLTGRRAFEAESQASLIASIIKEDPRPVSTLMPMAPRSLDRLVRRCMDKQPDERWQSIRDVGHELRWTIQNPEQPTAADAAAERTTRVAWLPWAVATAAVILTALFAIRGLGPEPEPASATRVMIAVPGATRFGDEGTAPPIISPDGKIVVFGVMDDNGNDRLWQRSLDNFNARPIEGTDNAQYPFWSPDSRHVGFFADDKLNRVEVATGRVQTVTESSFARGGSWSADGMILFVPTSNSGVRVVEASGGTARQLTQPDPDVPDGSHRWPEFLPDGQHYLFVSWTNDLEARKTHGGIYLAALDGEEAPRRILADASRVAYVPGFLLVMRGDNLIAVPFDALRHEVTGEAIVVASNVVFDKATGYAMFSASLQGSLVYSGGAAVLPARLNWYDRGGGGSSAVGEPAPYSRLRLSPDSRFAVAGIVDPARANEEIWIVDLGRGVRTRLASGPWYHEYPVWSPKGDRVMYGSQERGGLDFFVSAADGSGGKSPVFVDGTDKALWDWSRDGKSLAYTPIGDAASNRQIWIFSLENEEGQPLLTGNANYSRARFSPDTRWIAYVSDESGQSEIFVQGIGAEGGNRAGGRWQVSTAGGMACHWRDDGRELIYTDLDGRFMAVPVDARPGGLVLGAPQELFEINDRIVAADITGDHQRFLIATQDESVREPLYMVLNWTADLPCEVSRLGPAG